jgi:tRNA threonylcarbamoyl adenosine modification protein YeaZ
LVEQRTENPCVGGSNPPLGTIPLYIMPNILAFDTTSRFTNIALSANGKIYQVSSDKENNHSEEIIILINSLLQQASISFQDLDEVITCRGPGSFTGTRIGLAVAKGLKLTTRAKIFAISNFQAIACSLLQQKITSPEIMILINCGKNRAEFFSQLFDNKFNIVSKARIISEKDLQTLINEKKYYFISHTKETKLGLQEMQYNVADLLDYKLLPNITEKPITALYLKPTYAKKIKKK